MENSLIDKVSGAANPIAALHGDTEH